MLPAGVENSIPSPISFLIRVLLLIFNFNKEVCLLCLNNEASLQTNNKTYLIKDLISHAYINDEGEIEETIKIKENNTLSIYRSKILFSINNIKKHPLSDYFLSRYIIIFDSFYSFFLF